jgi:hypothetical protein
MAFVMQSCKELSEDEWDVQSCTTACTALNSSSSSSASGSDDEGARSFFGDDNSDGEDVWCPRPDVTIPADIPAGMGLTVGQEQLVKQRMHATACELLLREELKEEILRNGMPTLRKSRRSSRTSSASPLANSVMNEMATAVSDLKKMIEDNQQVIRMQAAELRSMKEGLSC